MSIQDDPTATRSKQIKRILFGKPRDLEDSSLLRKIALAPLLAWVGLGADGLSSSAYGPDEAFRTLAGYEFLAIPLALLVTTTIFVLCVCYGRIIYYFPQGGGGYGVASATLGKKTGLVAGSALLIDYVLTVAVSISSASEQIVSALPALDPAHVVIAVGLVILITLANLRGVREAGNLFAVPTYLFVGSALVAQSIVVGQIAHALLHTALEGLCLTVEFVFVHSSLRPHAQHVRCRRLTRPRFFRPRVIPR